MTFPFARPRLAASILSGIAIAGGLAAAVVTPTTPAHAFIVFDPSNYSQNVLTAARTLEQINNQIRSLQNQAQGLINQAKNLATIDFPEVQAITQTMQQIDNLMAQARAVQFRVAGLDQQLRQLYPESFGKALTLDAQVAAARRRLDTEMSAYQQTMGIQAQVAENVQADAGTLNAIIARSQGAQGALQASQATNQLLALVAKQQFQLQQMMAAQFRADAIERANRAQAEADARAATTRFLGSGSAYTPQ